MSELLDAMKAFAFKKLMAHDITCRGCDDCTRWRKLIEIAQEPEHRLERRARAGGGSYRRDG